MLDIQKTINGCHIIFQGEFSIFDAQSVYEELRPILLEKQTITFDLTHILSIDTSVIQIFMFIKSYLKQHGGELSLVNHSSAVLSLMERLGLVNWFNDPVLLAPDEADAKHKNPGGRV